MLTGFGLTHPLCFLLILRLAPFFVRETPNADAMLYPSDRAITDPERDDARVVKTVMVNVVDSFTGGHSIFGDGEAIWRGARHYPVSGIRRFRGGPHLSLHVAGIF